MFMQQIMRVHNIGIVLGIIHFAAVIYAVYMFDVNDLVWLWIIFFPIDFPFSLLTISGLQVMQNVWSDVHWVEEWKHIVYNYWPVFIHGVIGSLWWGTIPTLVRRFVVGSRKKPNI